MRCLTSAALAAGLLTVATPAWAQTAAPLLPAAPGPIPGAVVDLRASMAMLGQDAVTATGREALLMLERVHFDVVLMDVQMPDMDGLQAAALIR